MSCPVVQINYRLDSNNRFPTPVHDTLAGYDWVLRNLLPKRSIVRSGRSERVGKVGVCGELIGGGLATMLALTECRTGQPGVVAAAVNNPIVDWVSVAASEPGRKTSQRLNGQQPTIRDQLRTLRARVFRKPEHYFDPFASPLLLFRSAGVAIPAARVEVGAMEDEMDQLALLEKGQYLLDTRTATGQSPEMIADSNDEVDDITQVRRRSSRRYPSHSLGLKLPAFNITASQNSCLADQATELNRYLRQSFLRQSRSGMAGHKMLNEDEDDLLDDDEEIARRRQKADAASRYQLSLHNDLGLWDSTTAGQQQVEKVASWLRIMLA